MKIIRYDRYIKSHKSRLKNAFELFYEPEELDCIKLAYMCLGDDLNVVGFLCYQENGYISHLGVLPEFQRRGIARDMIEKLKASKPVIFLDTLASNEKALNLYKKCGFNIADEYELDGEKCVQLQYSFYNML